MNKKLRTKSNKKIQKEKRDNSPGKTLNTRKTINKSNQTNKIKKNKNKNKKIKEKFEDDADSNLVDFLKVSVDDNSSSNYVPLHEREYETESKRYTTYITKYVEICFKYGLMVALMTMNFIALSLSLNCNADQEFFKRVFSAIFAFFFGFIYIIVNYYTYRVLVKGQICKMNKEKLFPFAS